MIAAVVRVFRALARATRVALTWGALAPFYYLCFVPGRLILALRGRDPLRRAFPAPGASCWDARGPAPKPARYRKPFA